MWLLTLILIALFGFSTFSESTERASVGMALQTSEATPLAVDDQPVTALGVEPVSGEMRYVATASDLWMPGRGSQWQRAGVNPGHETIVVDSRDDQLLWAGTPLDCYRGAAQPMPMVQSTDAGATWTEAGQEGAVPLASWMKAGIAVAHDCSGLLISTDAGSTWAVPEGYPLGSQVTAFAVASTPESTDELSLLAGATGEGGTSQLYRVTVPGDGAPVVEGPLQTYYGLGSLAVLDDGAYLLGAPQGVMRSDDRGETWSAFRGGLESTTLEQDPVEVFPADLEPGSFGLRSMLAAGDETYVSGVDGIYRWSEADSTWAQLAPMDAEVERLALTPGATWLYARTVDGDVLEILLV